MPYVKPKVSQPKPPRKREVKTPIPDRPEKPKKPTQAITPVEKAKVSAPEIPESFGSTKKK